MQPHPRSCGALQRARTPSRRALQKYQYCWVVDPLDGTKEFIKRVPHFTVNIALIKGSQPVMGVVCTPAAQTMHFAVAGQGAYVRCALLPTPTGTPAPSHHVSRACRVTRGLMLCVRGDKKQARCRTLTGDDRQVRCKDYSVDAAGMSIVGSASHMNQLTQDFMAKHKDPSPVQVGSSLKFLLVCLRRALCILHALRPNFRRGSAASA